MAKTKRDNAKESVLSVLIDRIEEDLAVLTLSENDDVQFELPLVLLPEEANAGDWLKLTFALDDESTNAARGRIAALQAELTEGTEQETEIKL
jgi:hypothetical protein